jgi:thiosulfate/3-mercaptopyruvate sulfurtransferase
MFTTLIDPATLAAHLDDPSWVVLDARFDLAEPARGRAQYDAGHVPGARYVDLNRDLSAEKTGHNGRHPLPTPDVAAARFGALGIGPAAQVVVYDADTSMYAARAWWMLRWLGHDAVAVLDGGLARWVAEGRPVTAAVPTWTPVTFEPRVRAGWRLTADEVSARLGDPAVRLVDARSKERYLGRGETIDPVAGHIPGATSCFYGQNLTEARTFKPAGELRAQWAPIVGDDPQKVVMYCGSGVTACHNLLALEVAGLPGARIFPGSWSEWVQDPARPVATDDESA